LTVRKNREMFDRCAQLEGTVSYVSRTHSNKKVFLNHNDYELTSLHTHVEERRTRSGTVLASVPTGIMVNESLPSQTLMLHLA
jgi:hypothetical protein